MTTSPRWRDWLPRLTLLAQRAGSAVLEIRNAGLTVEFKGDQSPVTRADRAAEDIILAGLTDLAPDIPVISEERAAPSWPVRRPWQALWLVDPLDGTREFVAGRDSFVINIALVVDGSPVLGLIHQPATRWTVAACQTTARRGQWHSFQQWGEDAPLELNPGAAAAGVLKVVVSEHYGDSDIALIPAILRERYPDLQISRVGGALKFCMLASGQADYYVRGSATCEWDTAAGQAILAAVGGGLRSHAGAPFFYNRRETLRNPGFHAWGPRLGFMSWKLCEL